jgi:hypothetical protein
MLWFKTEKEVPCPHRWSVTDVFHGDVEVPPYYRSEDSGKRTTVSRSCRRCLLQEQHRVVGHIDRQQAVDIFGGSGG